MSRSLTPLRGRALMSVIAASATMSLLLGLAPTARAAVATLEPASVALGALPSGERVQLIGWVGDAVGNGVAGVPVRLERATASGRTVIANLTSGPTGYVSQLVAQPSSVRATYRLTGGEDLVAVASVGTTAVTPKPESTPPGDREVDVPGLVDVEIDDVHGRVLATADGSLRVYDPDLNLLRTVPIAGSPSELALSPDQTTLYIAQENLRSVAVVDTATFAILGRIRLPAAADLNAGILAVEVAGQQLVVAFGDGYSLLGNLVVVSLQAPRNTAVAQYDGGPIAASPVGEEVVTVGNVFSAPATIWSVAGGVPTVTDPDFAPQVNTPYNLRDVDYRPDGGAVLAAGQAEASGPFSVDRATEQLIARYRGATYPASVAYSRDGSVVATSHNGHDDHLRLWDAKTGTRIATLPPLEQDAGPYDYQWYKDTDGLALSSGGRRLYAAWSDDPYRNDHAKLEMRADPLVSCRVSVRSATLDSGGSVSISGTVTGRGGPAVGGASLTARRDLVGAGTAGSATASVDGTFNLTLPASAGAGIGTAVRVEAQLSAGRPCSAAATVAPRGPSAPPAVATYAAADAFAIFWVLPSDPGSAPITTQSVIVVRDGEVVRWTNLSPTDWYAVFTDLEPGSYDVFLFAWNSFGPGAMVTRRISLP